MDNLTKNDLVISISQNTGLNQADVLSVIQQTLDQITDALAKGHNVELRNFGVLEVRLTKARVGRNPKKPATRIAIPARATVKFKPGKVMRIKVLKLSASMKRAAAAGPSDVAPAKASAKPVAKAPAKPVAKAPAKPAAKAPAKSVAKAPAKPAAKAPAKPVAKAAKSGKKSA